MTPRKPNANSPLQTLPEDRQDQIIERLKIASREDVLKWLLDDGFKTSPRALSEFWSWWHLRQSFKQTKSDVETILDNIRRDRESKGKAALTQDEIFQYGQEMFSVMAVSRQDAKEWARIQAVGLEERRIAGLQRKVKVAEEALKLAEEKFQFNAAELCLKHLPALRKIAADNSLSEEDKLTQVRLKLFGVTPE